MCFIILNPLTVDIDGDSTGSRRAKGIGSNARVGVNVPSVDRADGEDGAPPHLTSNPRLPHPEVGGRGVGVRGASEDH